MKKESNPGPPTIGKPPPPPPLPPMVRVENTKSYPSQNPMPENAVMPPTLPPPPPAARSAKGSAEFTITVSKESLDRFTNILKRLEKKLFEIDAKLEERTTGGR